MFKKSLAATLMTLGIALAPLSGHATMLGLVLGEPTLDFGGASIISYDVATGIVTISGTPSTLFQSDPFILGEVLGTGADDEKLVTIKFLVDRAGAYVSGIDGPDFVVTGSIDVDFDSIPDYDGVLLQGEVTQFGFLDGGAAASDGFDLHLRFDTAMPGTLAPLYTGKDLGVTIVSEDSTEFPTPFAGSFATSFTAPAKAVIGSVDPLPPPPPPVGTGCKIDVVAFCSVDSGPFKNKCRVKIAKSPKHWEHEHFVFDGHSCRHPTYGMHDNPVPSWASRYQSTPVAFKYVVTNTGTTPIANLLVKDSFDTPLDGVPATLAPGQSVILLRTENLNDGIDVVVKAFGTNAPARCGDKDIVVIKDKMRERREHDNDHFRDKGRK